MSKTRNRLASVVRARAVWMVLDQEGEHASRWAAVSSIAGKIGCTAQTLNERVKRFERDSGVRAGVPTVWVPLHFQSKRIVVGFLRRFPSHFRKRLVPATLRESTEFIARSNPFMARLELPGAANLTVIRRPEANPAAAGRGLRWPAAWEAVTLIEPLQEALRTRLSPLRDTGQPFQLRLNNVTGNRPPAIDISHHNAF